MDEMNHLAYNPDRPSATILISCAFVNRLFNNSTLLWLPGGPIWKASVFQF
jgi:hypothetical protein